MGAYTLDPDIAAMRRRTTIALFASNLLGASLDIAFLALVGPYPIGFVDAPDGVVARNLIAGGVIAVLGSVYATRWERRWFSRLSDQDALRGPRALLIPC